MVTPQPWIFFVWPARDRFITQLRRLSLRNKLCHTLSRAPSLNATAPTYDNLAWLPRAFRLHPGPPPAQLIIASVRRVPVCPGPLVGSPAQKFQMFIRSPGPASLTVRAKPACAKRVSARPPGLGDANLAIRQPWERARVHVLTLKRVPKAPPSNVESVSLIPPCGKQIC